MTVFYSRNPPSDKKISLKECAVSLTENASEKRLNLVHNKRMKLIMNITIGKLEQFLTGNQAVAFLVDCTLSKSIAQKQKSINSCQTAGFY